MSFYLGSGWGVMEEERGDGESGDGESGDDSAIVTVNLSYMRSLLILCTGCLKHKTLPNC